MPSLPVKTGHLITPDGVQEIRFAATGPACQHGLEVRNIDPFEMSLDDILVIDGRRLRPTIVRRGDTLSLTLEAF